MMTIPACLLLLAQAALAAPGAGLWTKRYDGPGNGTDASRALGVSPDGSTVFVTGTSDAGSTSGFDFATVAYDASIGTRQWVTRYDGPANGSDGGADLGVSPDGSTVFVTGSSDGGSSGPDYTTVAYDASSGNELWAKHYNGPANRGDGGRALGVSLDGSTVFVTGTSDGGSSGPDYATVAYDTSTGGRRWVSRYDGPGSGGDVAYDLGVSPDGSTVFVTGRSTGSTTLYDYATVAYDASSGNELWTKRYNGRRNRSDFAYALGVSPDSSRVFVTGFTMHDYGTVAYDASSGNELWVKRYDGPANYTDVAKALTVSPDGSTVFVTGSSYGGSPTGYDYATVAYDASTGTKRWAAKRYDGPGNGYDFATALGVSPDGSAVFATGYSDGASSLDDYATVAYDASTGAGLWVRRYDGPGNATDVAYALGVSPDGSTVFVTGGSNGGSPTFDDYATVAYSTA